MSPKRKKYAENEPGGFEPFKGPTWAFDMDADFIHWKSKAERLKKGMH